MRIGAACWVSAALIAGAGVARGQVGEVRTLAPDVYFHEGDIAKGHCNNGWVVLEDYVLVVDANFPSGARAILPKIRALSTKPIRFAFDTHHHGDHAYGNQVWVDEGAVPLAHTGVVEEMKKYETGHYGGKPGRWEQEAKEREDLKGSRLKPPSLLFPDRLIFDDGQRRVELLHLGTAHTHGDGLGRVFAASGGEAPKLIRLRLLHALLGSRLSDIAPLLRRALQVVAPITDDK